MVAILLLALAGCAQPSEGSAADAVPAGPVRHDFGPAFGGRLAGPLITLDWGRLSEDRTVITVEFTAGPPFDAADPCATEDIRAWVGADAEGGLAVAVGSVTVPDAATLPPVGAGGIARACTLMGWAHQARLQLPAAYAGRTLRDLAANRILWVDPPEPYIVPGGLPDGWVRSQDFSTGWDTPPVWTSVFVGPNADPDAGWGDPGHLVLRQGLDGAPAPRLEVATAPEPVTVAGRPGSLRRDPANGQLELAWSIDGVPLQLAGYERDIPRDAFIALAAAMRRDDEPRPVSSP